MPSFDTSHIFVLVPNYPTRYKYGVSRSCHQSRKAFVFSLINDADLPAFQSFPYRNFGRAVCADSRKGPVFGNDISIGDFAHGKTISSSNLGDTYRPPGYTSWYHYRASTLLAGNSSFSPDEIEVYYEKILPF